MTLQQDEAEREREKERGREGGRGTSCLDDAFTIDLGSAVYRVAVNAGCCRVCTFSSTLKQKTYWTTTSKD